MNSALESPAVSSNKIGSDRVYFEGNYTLKEIDNGYLVLTNCYNPEYVYTQHAFATREDAVNFIVSKLEELV